MLHATFTGHAFERVGERLHLSPSEVAQLLDEDKCIPLGKDGSSNRLHRVFFSEADSHWFVAIQDETTGEVVTVLPVDYHNRWEISGDALSLARAKVLGEEPILPLCPKLTPSPTEMVFKFAAVVRKIKGRNFKKRIVGLGSISYPSKEFSQAMHDPAVRCILHDRLTKQLADGEELVELNIRHGQQRKIKMRLTALL